MDILVSGNTELGVELGKLPFGSVAKLARGGDAFYLIASPMDGSGRRVAVSLGGGSTKDFEQHTRMVPVKAVLHVEGT